MAASLTRLFVRQQHAADTLTLSAHELRDIGLAPSARADPTPYDLLDLMPRVSLFGHRQPH